MTKTLMTFGDSNTHGTPPIEKRGTYARYGVGVRWPTVTYAALGAGWDMVEEGLPGRTTAHADPLMGPHMDGQLGLRIALQSHGPIDLLTIMLGTNDLKAHFGLTPEGITAGVAGLLAIAHCDEYQTRHGGFEVMLICPPLALEQGPLSDVYYGAAAKSAALAPLYAGLARHWRAKFLDAGQHISPSQTDGVHFEPDAHVTLGRAVAAAI
ncbi:Lysophospholipase L1 [Yoonia tamlensis]|uniref:Lysophospholipase L1 n=1 Tax=Yoonia tamlensis TaxID=390270 RepID=A0A1I6HPQ2_9RHOB|nr:GDSL-type esterase/lipase family protein [Yoonia tamlensis]SFR56471.1 Lysophospholipase L1 [Yoonia tamlensis]